MNLNDSGSQPVPDGHPEGILNMGKSGTDSIATKSIWPIPIGMEEVARNVAEATEHLTRAFGFSGEEGDRLALQSRQNMDAIKRCGTVISQSIQKSSQSWMGVIQNQWVRNFDGMNRLMQAKSVHEFGTAYGDLTRENLEHLLKESRAIAEKSMQAADEAGKSLASLAISSAGAKA